MKQAAILLVFTFSVFSGMAQREEAGLSQKIKGAIVDADSKKTLPGATIALVGTPYKTIADENGNFSIRDVRIGRQSLEVSLVGYESRIVNDIMVTSGKEVFLNIPLTGKIGNLNEVIIRASKNKTKANNEFATVSARSFSTEDTKRYPAAAFDPARMAQNFAGVSSNGDGSNEIVVRGNSPKGVLWRLEGIEIPSPNHFGSLGNSGGAISMLSSSTLGSSDFYTGAFPAEFGNATAGVFDLNFRNGNKDKREYSLMAGLLGIEAAAEGPFKKGGQSSYLINYRYSSVALVSDFLDIGGVVPKYQDLSFKLNFPTKKGGTFGLFGLGGRNRSVKVPVKDSTKWTDEDPNFVLDAPGKLGVAGLTHQIFFNKQSYLKTIIAASGQLGEAIVDTLNPSNDYRKVATGKEKNLDITYRVAALYNNKISNESTIRIGFTGSRLAFDYNNSYYDDVDGTWKQNLEAKGNSFYYQAYLQWKYRISNTITLNTGLHASYLQLNKTSSIEPRAALTIKASHNQTFTLAAGIHAKPEHLSTYFFENTSNGYDRATPNKNLKMNKALHLILGYDKMLNNNIRFKTEIYYQYLYDVAVEKQDYSYFSILNSASFYDLTDIGPLVSSGTGKNYGVDISLEKPFNKNYFFLATGSLYASKYTNYNNKEFNTRYNRNYQVNLVTGKEWKRKKNPNSSWGINAKLLTSGGLRESEIDLAASRARGKVMYITDRYYTKKTTPYFRFDTGMNFKINRKHSTHTISIDIQNLTSNKNLYTSYYDNDSNAIKKEYQLGLFPFLNYRIEF